MPTFSGPVTNQRTRLARSSTGYVNVIRRRPWYAPAVGATSRLLTSRTASPGTNDAVWPSGPSPRCARSSTGGEPATPSSARAYWAAAASRSADSTGIAWICSGRSGARESRLSRRCVRFRSGSPAGATRSSTCITCSRSHGTSCPARSRNICHGVCPPLTATTNRPRAATAARASAATNAAASRATASASPNTSIFMGLGGDLRVGPAARGHDTLLDLGWPPRAGLVVVDRRARLQHRIDDTPRLFHVILAREQGGVALHRVTQHPLVGIHLVRVGVTGSHHLSRRADRF